MEKGDTVKYIGPKHPVLEQEEDYVVFSCNETDVQVITQTGFAGVPMESVILVKIKG